MVRDFEYVSVRASHPATRASNHGLARTPPPYGIAGVDSGRALVQMRRSAPEQPGTDMHAAAAHGVRAPAGELPHLQRIAASFGPAHELASVRAHLGGAASQAARSIGAHAYASGEHVVFERAPSLHLAAHEAAHVIQQRRGVSQASDAFERHADAVAERVVAGDSAAPLLDALPSGQPSTTVQRTAAKQVSPTALLRLAQAKSAMTLTKSVLKHGAGNQVKALKATKYNSFYRLKVARDETCWDVSPAVNDLITADRPAYLAARAFVAQGGNCGEHALIAFEFLRRLAKGQHITRASKRGLDHAFVIIGDLSMEGSAPKEPDNELAVADAWPTSPTATLWEDHFAYTPKRADIEQAQTTVANGSSSMMAIVAGIKPNAKGLALLQKTDDDSDVDERIGKAAQLHLWDHPDAAAAGKHFSYYTQFEPTKKRIDLP